jgi:hypothetical protein
LTPRTPGLIEAVGRVGLLAGIAALTCGCVHTPSAAPPSQPVAAQFRATITRLDGVDSNSPSALEAHLEYADFLVEQDPGGCGQRLDLARSQVDLVAKNPAAEVVFPGGWARVAELQYRIHRGRADCDAEPAVRGQELHAAIEAAQRAVQYYRHEFDYASMAVAKFNVAATYHALRENTQAIGALETAIEMDREFGLRSDAQENYGLLLSWRQEPAGPDQVAQLMRDFPTRTAALKFAWSPADAAVTISSSHAKVVENRVFRAQMLGGIARQIRAAGDDWVVSDANTDGAVDLGVWPGETEGAVGPVPAFHPTLLQFPSVEITHSGDFKAVNELAAFATHVTADAQSTIRAHAPKGEPRALLDEADRTVQIYFAPEEIEGEVRENYELESAMWIGATLQQGVQYELIAPLPLPGVPQVTTFHQLKFSFTREVPCTSLSTGHSCVELIVRASPQAEPLREIFGELKFPHGEALSYSSASTVRIITDPVTLRPYLHETRQYWYATLGKQIPRTVMLESEHSVITSTYR